MVSSWPRRWRPFPGADEIFDSGTPLGERPNQNRIHRGWHGLQLPGGALWKCAIKIGEKFGVSQVPATTGVVCYRINRSGDVMVARNIAVSSLVEHVEA